ncbi:MAG: hypothetical protein HY322_14385 [Betaproteobacteria bacterium]|nr:hypothetical protein [Betaproteobacteria bacterium]
MNKTISGLMLALLTMAGSAQVFAAERERGTGARQQSTQRMQQGVRSGDVARAQTRSFQRGTTDVRRTEQRSRSDGQVARGDGRNFNHDFNRQSRDVRRERHDGDRRWAGRDDRFRAGRGHDGRFASNDRFGRAQGQHRGWENNRGNHYGWDNNRGRHYGWDNNRGRHYGWENNRGRHYGWGNDHGRPTYGGGQWIDRRQHQQQQRIVQGLRSGELTRHEANRLFSEQRDLRRQERVFRSDGVLTPWERGEMRKDLNSAGRHIYNETHDAQRRF